MSEFMQESIDFGESKQGRFVFCRFGKVHGDRHMRPAVGSVFFDPLFLVAGHPGSGPFAGTGMKICIKQGQIASVLVEYFVGLYIRMINRDVVIFLECDSVQACCQTENSFLDLIQFEVGAKKFFVQTELLIFQFFGIVAEVPGHQLEVISFQTMGQCFNLGHFLVSCRGISFQ